MELKIGEYYKLPYDNGDYIFLINRQVKYQQKTIDNYSIW